MALQDKVTLPFHVKWLNTWTCALGYFGIGLPIQLSANGPTLVWALAGLVLLVAFSFLDRKSWPDRLRRRETKAWAESLTRTPDGGAIITQADWARRPAELRRASDPDSCSDGT